MGCWPGHRHAGAPPPASGLGGARGFLRTRSYHKPCAAAISCAQLPGSHKPCVSACGRVCSPPPAFSTSPWLLGTLARSLPWRCAAACVGIGRGTGELLRTHNCQGGSHKPCACAGSVQEMFRYAAVFNQPLEAWDVGQVASMSVRRRPRRDWEGHRGALAHTQLPRWWPQAMRVCWRGAVYVRLRGRFQPALGSMGRWPGHQHVCAPPPASGL